MNKRALSEPCDTWRKTAHGRAAAGAKALRPVQAGMPERDRRCHCSTALNATHSLVLVWRARATPAYLQVAPFPWALGVAGGGLTRIYHKADPIDGD